VRRHDLLAAVHGASEWSFCSGWTGKLFTRPATCNVAGHSLLLTATGGAVSGFAWLENDAGARTLPSSEVWCLNGGGPSVAAHALPEQSTDATPDRRSV
jgi:hypothetical protein